MVAIADDLFLLVFPATTQTGPALPPASATSAAIHGQTDEGAARKRLVALGLAKHPGQSLSASWGLEAVK
jgi:hypothetical protein